MKTILVTIATLAALTSVASAQWNNSRDGDRNQRRIENNERGATSDLAFDSAIRGLARTTRQLGGPSDAGAKSRLEQSCIQALESGVENSVRRSYGCSGR